MSTESPSFYAIIPANVRYSKNLEPNAKLLYGEITALTHKEGYCWASNKYFADLYTVSERSITNWLSSLEKEGFIQIETEKCGMKWNRKIWIIQKELTNGKKFPDREEKNFPYERKKTSTDVLHRTNNTDKEQQQQAKPASAAAASKTSFLDSIEFFTPGGIKKIISESEIYSHFLKKKFSTETLQKAIQQVKKKNEPIGNVFRLLETICEAIESEGKSPQKQQEVYGKSVPLCTEKGVSGSLYTW